MKSIIQDRDSQYCFLCGILHEDYAPKMHRQEHHCVHGKGNSRTLSTRYGLMIYLCDKHHTYDQGPEAVHRNHDIDLIVKKAAQYAFMLKFPELNFRDIFGKNYLELWELPETKNEMHDGFRNLEDDDNSNHIDDARNLL